ncbi:hypothetical protein RvY_19261 [Ramazzottius varieornatus]|uniref:18 kDa Sin3-associated polypeptide n=1 Tax=Ramazzottius varieornatus TaxID=947166 RepID=A0A1D1W8U4_RAMVA|nr:hypothetical protein RvY_19261 [Ramazzottius varieornatus]
MTLYVPMAPERGKRPSLQVRSSGGGNFEREIIQVRIPGDNGRAPSKERGDGRNGPERHLNKTTENDFHPDTRDAPEVVDPNKFSVDREKVCPFLLRVFCNTGRHYPLSEFAHGNTPTGGTGELQVYTWLDATLKELSGLIRDVHPEARRRGTIFEFNLVYPDHGRSSNYRSRHIGAACNGQKGQDDGKMLSDVRFQIGDFMSVAIVPAPEDRLY